MLAACPTATDCVARGGEAEQPTATTQHVEKLDTFCLTGRLFHAATEPGMVAQHSAFVCIHFKAGTVTTACPQPVVRVCVCACYYLSNQCQKSDSLFSLLPPPTSLLAPTCLPLGHRLRYRNIAIQTATIIDMDSLPQYSP